MARPLWYSPTMDDTQWVLGQILGCAPTDVIAEVEHLVSDLRQARRELHKMPSLVPRLEATLAVERKEWATERAEWKRLTEFLQKELDFREGERQSRASRVITATALAPTPGRFRSSILAALRRNKEWGDIDEASYHGLIAQPCSYCGGDVGGGIGLDRLDNKRGYYLDNVVPSCGPCNIDRHRKRGGRLPPNRTKPEPPPPIPGGI